MRKNEIAGREVGRWEGAGLKLHRILIALVTAASLCLVPATMASASEGCANDAVREEQAATFLPDCRAYELVSPPDKGGGQVDPTVLAIRPATDGSAVTFATSSAFGDARSLRDSSEYMAQREGGPGTTGWQTHGISPVQEAGTIGNPLRHAWYVGEFTEDLNAGIFWSDSTALTNSPNVQEVPQNLYLRNDLRTPGAGSYELVTAAAEPVPSPPLAINYQELDGASSDLSHIVFDSKLQLTSDAPPTGPLRAYESERGTVRLAGVLPDGTAAPESTGLSNMSNAPYFTRMISRDGSRVAFQVGGNDETGGELYVRIDHSTTVQLNESERAVPAPHQSAIYQTMSVDGKFVFFTSAEPLTEDAPEDGSPHLYMYDTSKPGSDPHNLTMLDVDNEPADSGSVRGVFAVSEDGSYVYFADANQLISGAPLPPTGLLVYVWHAGTLKYVGELNDKPGQDDQSLNLLQRNVSGQVEARVTPDGRHLLFASSASLTGVDQSGCGGRNCVELYFYNGEDETLACVSCSPTGAPAESDAEVFHGGKIEGTPAYTGHWTHPLSEDGEHVFFDTADALVPQDTNGKRDVYEYDVSAGQAHLLTSGHGATDALFMDATPNGRDVFLWTTDRLVAWDTDASADVYDVRSRGGFPEPQVSGSGCIGEACQGEPSMAPIFEAPSSVESSGGGNLTIPQATVTPRKAKTKAKRHRARHKHRRKHRPAHKNGRRVINERKGKRR